MHGWLNNSLPHGASLYIVSTKFLLSEKRRKQDTDRRKLAGAQTRYVLFAYRMHRVPEKKKSPFFFSSFGGNFVFDRIMI
jgi:hypothetical protein